MSAINVDAVISAVRTAGDQALQSFRSRDYAVQMKGDIDPVTDADLAAESILRSSLLAVAEARFVGEESYDGQPVTTGWVVDPIDGTVNFASGFAMWAVNVAWVVDGIATVAVTYAPALDEMFWAVRGEGAYLQSAGKNTRLAVCSDACLQDSVGATGFPYWLDTFGDEYNNIDAFRAVLKSSRAVRRAGCASLDLAYVAAGRFGFYWEPGLKPWDVLAGSLIVQEAGGEVSGYDGQQLRHGFAPIAASNGLVHAELLTIIADFEMPDALLPYQYKV